MSKRYLFEVVARVCVEVEADDLASAVEAAQAKAAAEFPNQFEVEIRHTATITPRRERTS